MDQQQISWQYMHIMIWSWQTANVYDHAYKMVWCDDIRKNTHLDVFVFGRRLGVRVKSCSGSDRLGLQMWLGWGVVGGQGRGEGTVHAFPALQISAWMHASPISERNTWSEKICTLTLFRKKTFSNSPNKIPLYPS